MGKERETVSVRVFEECDFVGAGLALDVDGYYQVLEDATSVRPHRSQCDELVELCVGSLAKEQVKLARNVLGHCVAHIRECACLLKGEPR